MDMNKERAYVDFRDNLRFEVGAQEHFYAGWEAKERADNPLQDLKYMTKDQRAALSVGLNTRNESMASDPVCKVQKVQASARVTLTVEISVDDTWGNDCRVDQIQRQAAESALGILRRMKEPHRMSPFKIIGDPKVTMILVDRAE